jgi:hypothetical protein
VYFEGRPIARSSLEDHATWPPKQAVIHAAGVSAVTCFYFYVWDERCGPGFIKVCSYAPYPIKIWLNGHEIVKRMAAGCGIAVTPLANGFAAATDPAGLQELCEQIEAGTLRVFFDRWAARIPLPLTGADRAGGYWWETSMRQVEVARTLVFDDPRRVRTVFEQLLAGNLDLGRPEHVEVIFGRKVTARTPGVFSTRLLNRADQVSVNFGFKHSRVKIYLKEDRALRVETVVNDPADLGCRRGLDHLDQLVSTARAINARLMEAVRVGQGCGVLASPVFERIARPTRTSDGRTRVPAMRFGDPRVQALAGALAVLGFAVTGITKQEPPRLDDRTARHAVQHEPSQLRPGPAQSQPAHRTDPAHQHLPAHRRRANLRDLLQQGARPRPVPADGRRPTDRRPTRSPSCPGHPRPTHRHHHRRRRSPARSLKTTPSGQRQTSQKNVTTKLKTTVKVLRPQGP